MQAVGGHGYFTGNLEGGLTHADIQNLQINRNQNALHFSQAFSPQAVGAPSSFFSPLVSPKPQGPIGYQGHHAAAHAQHAARNAFSP